jgi:hypothetical protein
MSMVRRSSLRASDADREYVTDRILAEELEQRLEATFSARTYGELGAVLSDLPRPRPAAHSARPSLRRLRPASVVALILLFPIALAVAAAVIVAALALFTAWAAAVTLAALFLGPRARMLHRGPWAVGYRAWHCRRSDRRVVGSFTPWL